jgi:hypothetical protein
VLHRQKEMSLLSFSKALFTPPLELSFDAQDQSILRKVLL